MARSENVSSAAHPYEEEGTHIIQGTVSRLLIVGGLFAFLWRRREGWLIPVVFLIVLFGTLIALVEITGLAPFIYAIF